MGVLSGLYSIFGNWDLIMLNYEVLSFVAMVTPFLLLLYEYAFDFTVIFQDQFLSFANKRWFWDLSSTGGPILAQLVSLLIVYLIRALSQMDKDTSLIAFDWLMWLNVAV
jgi:hypothetical protein